MFRAMVWKELREVRGIALLALAAGCYIVAAATHPGLWPFISQNAIPFVDDRTVGWLGFVWVIMAIALGLRQTLGESIHSTYPFLFHRPAEHRWLIGMKLLVGMAVYLICNAIPILAYSLWAATPGTHASPFEWSMTVPIWIVWFGMTILYLGSFLTGIRPGQWFRTRLLPLVAAALVTVGAMVIAFEYQELIGLSLAFVVDLWLMASIFFVARTRDYS